jgi:uncharacterized protein YegL
MTDTPPPVTPTLQPPAAASRPLYFIWICDCSDSMRSEQRMTFLNQAIRDSIPYIKKRATNNSKAEILMNTLKFSTGGEWVSYNFTPLEKFEWNNLSVVDGVTDLGEALIMVSKELKLQPEGKMEFRGYPPVVVLITDGYPTDDWETGLKVLMSVPWAERAIRMAVALPGADETVLNKFIGNVLNKDQKLIYASKNLENLADQIKLVSDVALGVKDAQKNPIDPVNTEDDDIPSFSPYPGE